MKKILFALPITLLFACGGADVVEEAKENVEAAAVKVCSYEINDSKPSVMWEAYKFTERAAVGGKMDSVSFSGLGTGETPEAVFANAEFKVFTASVNSNNPERDAKLVKHFFSVLKMPELITGKVDTIIGNELQVLFSINGVEKTVSLNSEILENDRIKISGSLDMTEFSGENAIASINKACDLLHKGKDGVSKLWPDFKVSLIADLKKNCE